MMWAFALIVAYAGTGLVPVQGAVTGAGGAPVTGVHAVTVRLYVGPSGTSSWDDEMTVFFDQGRFTAVLGSEAPLDLALFRQDGDLSVTIQVGAGLESERVVLGWAPRAGHAENASHLGGVPAASYALKSEALVPGAGLVLTGRDLTVDPNAFVARTGPGDASVPRDLAAGRNLSATGALTANTGSFSSTLAANGGLTGTTGSFSSTLAANGGLTGTTGTFSSTLAANGGLTGTSGSFSSTLAANGGLTGTTGTFSSTLAANGGLTANTANLAALGVGGAPGANLFHVQSATETIARISGDGPGYVNAAVLLEAKHNASAWRGTGTFFYDTTSQTEWFAGRPYAESDSFQILRRASATTPSSATADPCPGNASAPCSTQLLSVNNKGYLSAPEMPYFFGRADADNGASFSGYKLYRPVPVVSKGTLANGASWYDSATGIFTAPITGVYQFNWVVLLEGVDVGQFLDPRYGHAGTEYFYGPRYTFATSYVGDGYYPEKGTALLYMNAGETFYVNVGGTGGTANVYNNNTWTYLQGAFLH